MEIYNQTPYQFSCIAGRMNFPGFSLTLIIKSTFDLVPGGQVTVAEEQPFPTGDELYEDDDEGNGSNHYESDYAYFKPHADLLLVGSCHSPTGKPILACRVTFQVGSFTKTLGIFGDRFWQKGLLSTISDPKPFTRMDLRYENSFGGSDFKKNPVGKGYQKILTDDGTRIHPLPNIEDPRQLISSPQSLPEPAGFGPLAPTWALRMAKTGSYGGSWLEKWWPWFPEDFDWSFYNGAPPDMQVRGYLRGDEDLYFENLHPVHAQFKSRLPGIRTRCFCHRTQSTPDQSPQFQEVQLNLDTLWVDLDTEKLVLVWRGWISVQSEEFEDISAAFIVSEKLSEQPHPVDFYQRLFEQHMATQEFVPEAPEAEERVASINVAEEMAKSLAEAREEAIKAGLDPDADVPPPSAEDKALEAQILKELGYEEKEEIPPLTRDSFLARFNRGETFAGHDLRGLDLSNLSLPDIDLQQAILTGVNLENTDLTKANLNETALSKTNLRGAHLNEATLKDADLTEADLGGAHLDGAHLDGSLFEKANLENASLNAVMAPGAHFAEANLTRAQFKESNLQEADLSHTTLHETDFGHANLREASVEGACGRQVNMSEADLTELRASEGCDFSQGLFSKAIASESIWEAATLTEADFSFSTLEGANFSACRLQKANFNGANLKFAKFPKATLSQAQFIYTNLFQGSLEKADLTGTDFRGANLYGVEFLDAVLENIRFVYANLKMTKLDQ
ncbi:DUF2169 domain-containing protein [candidate division CSSED10-310 bacterium]|uniref:DUF2169 domain-containing protein n=1 Tax=candidate division CSSED10-310 bacterium TaxID=2855610 RepID=A0ABV6Z0U4_UNCC1